MISIDNQNFKKSEKITAQDYSRTPHSGNATEMGRFQQGKEESEKKFLN